MFLYFVFSLPFCLFISALFGLIAGFIIRSVVAGVLVTTFLMTSRFVIELIVKKKKGNAIIDGVISGICAVIFIQLLTYFVRF